MSERIDEALAKALNVSAARCLEEKLSAISEEHWCAGWMHDLEFDLWKIVEGGPREWGWAAVTDADVEALRWLRDQAGGWWLCDQFVTLDEWQVIYAERMASALRGAGEAS